DELPSDLIRQFVPAMSGDGIGAIFFEHTSGYVDGAQAGIGFIGAAVALGASARSGARVVRLKTSNGSVVGVDTTDGSILCSAVVLAAGAGSKRLASTADVNL